MDDDDDGDVKEKELQTEALLCAFETLGKSWPKNTQTQGKLSPQRPSAGSLVSEPSRAWWLFTTVTSGWTAGKPGCDPRCYDRRLFAARFQMEVCGLMSGKIKLSTWKVQLAVLQAMKAYFQK